MYLLGAGCSLSREQQLKIVSVSKTLSLWMSQEKMGA